MALPSSKPAGSDFPPKMIIIKGGHRRGGAGGYIHVRSLRRRETRSSGRADQDGGDPRRRSPRRSNSLASRDALPLSRPTCRRRPLPRRRGPSATLTAFAKRADSRRAGAGHHSHGTAMLVRREGLQVFTPSSSAIPHDSCPVRARPGRPPAALRPRASPFTHPFEAPGDPSSIFIKNGQIPSKTGHVFMKTMCTE